MDNEQKYVKVFSSSGLEKLEHAEIEAPSEHQPLEPVKVKLYGQEFEIPSEDIQITCRALIGIDE